MKRALLPFAMILSLWPLGLIAASAATDSSSSSSSSNSMEVTVDTPPKLVTPATQATESRVTLKSDGKTYSCPLGTGARLQPIDQRSATAELKLRAVRRDLKPMSRRLDQLVKLYPGKTAPSAVADEYNSTATRARRLIARENRLIKQFNRSVDEHNKIIDDDCD